MTKKPTGKRLNPDILRKVKADILEANKKQLRRCESMNRIKFPKKIFNADDLLIRVPKKVKTQMWTNSTPNLLDFEKYKQQHDFRLTSKKCNRDEREWVRGIWNVWFDEVIPQLDGTGGRPNSSVSVEMKEAKAASFTNTPIVEFAANEEEENDDEGKKRNATSPTPYAAYSQVDLEENENKPIDLEAVKLLEIEIDKITRRIETKITAFDLSRRGTLYRKVKEKFFMILNCEIFNKCFQIIKSLVCLVWPCRILPWLYTWSRIMLTPTGSDTSSI